MKGCNLWGGETILALLSHHEPKKLLERLNRILVACNIKLIVVKNNDNIILNKLKLRKYDDCEILWYDKSVIENKLQELEIKLNVI